MANLPLCRICLTDDFRMYEVGNKDLQALYETLTKKPFVTECCRPTLACYFCYTRLKQCYRFLRVCLQTEDLLAQIIEEDYEPNPLPSNEQIMFLNGYSKSSVVNIDIYGCQAESVAETRELVVVCERLDDVFKPEKMYQIDGTNVVEKRKPAARRSNRRDTTETLQTREKLECDKCQRKFSNKLQLIAHFPKNTFVKAFICDYCQCGFSSKAVLRNHIHRHIRNKPFKCDICDKSYLRSYHLQNHYLKHIGKKIHKCKVCPRIFHEKCLLTRHRRTHTGGKRYQRGKCPGKFCDKDALSKHNPGHTKRTARISNRRDTTDNLQSREKRFECDKCERKFFEKIDLDVHIFKHTGLRNYFCDYCQMGFIHKSYLIRHIRTHR